MIAKVNEVDIQKFLIKAKFLMSTNRYEFVPRKKNMQALAAHGLSINDVKSEILSLLVGDYYKGPKKDFDPNRPGDIWEFKKSVDKVKFYVKLKIVKVEDKYILRCLGFHEDDFV